MHVQSFCLLNKAISFFFDVLIAIAVVVAKVPCFRECEHAS